MLAIVEEHNDLALILDAHLVSAVLTGRWDAVLGFQTKGIPAELLILFCTDLQEAVEKYHILRCSTVFRKGAGDILPGNGHVLFAPVPDGKVGSVLNLGVLAAGKVRFAKDIAQEHHALHLPLGVVQVYARSAAGQSPCGGQHQSPDAELEKCSAVDYSDAPPVSAHSGSVTQERYPF